MIGDGVIATSAASMQQRRAKAYRAILQGNGLVASMSRKGNCHDNAPIESFWGSLKNEMIHHQRFETLAQAESAIGNTSIFFTTATAGIHGLVIWLPLCLHSLSHGWPLETGLSTIVSHLNGRHIARRYCAVWNAHRTAIISASPSSQ
uniref:Integrase catalytic domain-containing protein n=1 Tax=mine drainage metagenome TaxID=410659 RepID=E6QUY6_9ZZZZ